MNIGKLLYRDFIIATKSANGLILTFVINLITLLLYSFLSPLKASDHEFFSHMMLISLAFSAILCANLILSNDMDDGSIFQLIIFGVRPIELIIEKIIFHFLIAALPVILMIPILIEIFAVKTSISDMLYIFAILGISFSFISTYAAFTTLILDKNAIIGNLIAMPLMIAPMVLAKLAINFTLESQADENYFCNLLLGISLISCASIFLMIKVIFLDNLSEISD